jgi:hypothetical protein
MMFHWPGDLMGNKRLNWLSRPESCILTHRSCTACGNLVWQTARSAYAMLRRCRILRNVVTVRRVFGYAQRTD